MQCGADEHCARRRREVSREPYLQEGHEVLLHQVVAAGAHEQVDEPGGVVVTVLQDPGSTEGVRLSSRATTGPAAARGPGSATRGANGRGLQKDRGVCPLPCPPRPGDPGLTSSTWRRTCARRRSRCAPRRLHRREAPSSRGGSRRPAGGGVSATGHPPLAPSTRSPAVQPADTTMGGRRPPQPGGDTGLSGCPTRCRQRVGAAGTRSVSNANGQVPNSGNEAASEHPRVGRRRGTPEHCECDSRHTSGNTAMSRPPLPASHTWPASHTCRRRGG